MHARKVLVNLRGDKFYSTEYIHPKSGFGSKIPLGFLSMRVYDRVPITWPSRTSYVVVTLVQWVYCG